MWVSKYFFDHFILTLPNLLFLVPSGKIIFHTKSSINLERIVFHHFVISLGNSCFVFLHFSQSFDSFRAFKALRPRPWRRSFDETLPRHAGRWAAKGRGQGEDNRDDGSHVFLSFYVRRTLAGTRTSGTKTTINWLYTCWRRSPILQ
jgi:hypothetical protein